MGARAIQHQPINISRATAGKVRVRAALVVLAAVEADLPAVAAAEVNAAGAEEENLRAAAVAAASVREVEAELAKARELVVGVVKDLEVERARARAAEVAARRKKTRRRQSRLVLISAKTDCISEGPSATMELWVA